LNGVQVVGGSNPLAPTWNMEEGWDVSHPFLIASVNELCA